MHPNTDAGPVDPDAGPTQPQRRPVRARQWDILAAIAAGGVLGAEGRYLLGTLLNSGPDRWPTGTLLVNISGCLLLGAFMTILLSLTSPHRLARPFFGVGILGGYTTFSTATVEAQQLSELGHPGIALGYVAATAASSLVAAWVGIVTTRATLAGITARRRRRTEAARQGRE